MYAGGPGGDFLNMGIGGPGLMGNVAQNPMAGLMGPQMQPYQGPQFAQPQNGGRWSQLAYQMAGNPNQGPYASVATPPAPPGGNPSSGGSALGGTALGLLGSLAQNPGMAKNLGNLGSSALSKLGLLGSGVDTAGIGSAASAAAAGMGANVAPAVSAGLANTAGDVAAANSAWLAAQPAAAGAAAAGAAGAGLGAGAGLADVTGSLGAGLDAAAASSSAAVGGSGAGAAGAGGGAGAGGSGMGSALAAAAPYAAAALAVAAPFYGMFSAPYTMSKGWHDKVNSDYQDLLSKGPNDPNFMQNMGTLWSTGALSPEQKQQVQALYHQATDADTAQRMAWVQQAGGLPSATGGPVYGGGGGGSSNRNRS